MPATSMPVATRHTSATQVRAQGIQKYVGLACICTGGAGACDLDARGNATHICDASARSGNTEIRRVGMHRYRCHRYVRHWCLRWYLRHRCLWQRNTHRRGLLRVSGEYGFARGLHCNSMNWCKLRPGRNLHGNSRRETGIRIRCHQIGTTLLEHAVWNWCLQIWFLFKQRHRVYLCVVLIYFIIARVL